MLRLESVSYRYAGAARPSLHDVTLELGDGEVVGLVGASEAGKTTLCLVAAGLAPRVVGGTLRGRLLLNGNDLADEPMHALVGRVSIGFQNPTTQLSGVATTVFEEVAFGPMNLGVPRDELLDRTWSALATLRIEALAKRNPARLSGGQQQLVAMAGLLAMRPRHLILDEPTAQLDPAGTQLVRDAIALLAAGGASILVAEHKTDLLARVAARVVAIDAGRIVLDGSAGEVLADPQLRQLGVAEPAATRLLRLAGEGGLGDAAQRRLATVLTVGT
ncbi:MAG TPA: ABC transporter ATP-binding protein [Candidatus Limnocylindrales bacterium]|nr:ABC transporter ATP-binding protein [Candidatus Limnocylindrales bacterium]